MQGRASGLLCYAACGYRSGNPAPHQHSVAPLAPLPIPLACCVQESEGEEAEQSRVELPAEAGAKPGARQSRVRLYEVCECACVHEPFGGGQEGGYLLVLNPDTGTMACRGVVEGEARAAHAGDKPGAARSGGMSRGCGATCSYLWPSPTSSCPLAVALAQPSSRSPMPSYQPSPPQPHAISCSPSCPTRLFCAPGPWPPSLCRRWAPAWSSRL